MAARLDRTDLKILRSLQNNGRLSNAELAETVAISPATCHRRTQRLFEDGFIATVRAMVAPKKVPQGARAVRAFSKAGRLSGMVPGRQWRMWVRAMEL